MSRLRALRDRLPAPFAIVVLVALAVIPLIYASSLIGANEDPTGNLDHVPAAIVDADRPAEVTAEDGSTRTLALGDDIATQLLDDDSGSDFAWTRASAKDAAAGLADGSYLAVLEVPADFSATVAAALTVDPASADTAQRATLTIRTDDGSNYLAGNIAKSLGTALSDEVSSTVRAEYLAEVYLGFTDVHDSLVTAADGATQLDDGLGELASQAAALPDGLSRLAAGSSSAQSGAASLQSGLGTLAAGSASLAGGLDQLLAGYASLDDAHRLAALQQLDAAAHAVSSGSSSALAGSSDLASGLASLSSGLSTVSAEAPSLVSGIDQAHDGADTLATQLADGAAEVPDFDTASADALSTVTGTPIELVTVREHAVTGYGAGLAPYFLALGLWIGAVSTFLMRPALSMRALERRRPAPAVALLSYLPNAVLAVVQALAAVVIADAVLPIDAADLPGLAGMAVLTSLAFMAVVQALIALLGPVGRFFPLVLTVVQVSAAGGTYPIQTAPALFQVLHGALPLSHAMQAFRALIGGGSLGIATAIPVLLAWLIGALLVTTLAAMRAAREARRVGAAEVVGEELAVEKPRPVPA